MILTHQRRRAEDDDAFDDRGVLKDGRSMRVPMRLMDAADLPRIRDADGSPLGQPGFMVADKFRDARQVLYDEYDAAISEQWRSPPTGVGSHGFVGARSGDVCTIDGQAGHLRVVNGELKCVADKPSRDATPLRDEREAAYRRYDAELANAWRRG